MTQEPFKTATISDPSGSGAGFLPLVANPGWESGLECASTTLEGSDNGLNLIGETTSGQTRWYLHGAGIDEPLAVNTGGQTYYLASDGLGSVVATTDGSGNVVHAVTYDAWGNPKGETGTRYHSFTYTGRELGEAGLHFYRARFYDPAIGRFTQEDPIEARNLYTYVANHPLRFVDPDGEVLKLAPGDPLARLPAKQKDAEREKTYLKWLLGLAGSNWNSCSYWNDVIGSLLRLIAKGVDIASLQASILPNPAMVEIPAESAMTRLLLQKSMLSEEAAEELLAGGGRVMAGAGQARAIDDLPRLIAEYGGTAEDWVKISSSSKQALDGTEIAIHAYKDLRTGTVYEMKSIINR